jgi:hypothetical protein
MINEINQYSHQEQHEKRWIEKSFCLRSVWASLQRLAVIASLAVTTGMASRMLPPMSISLLIWQVQQPLL